MIAKIMMCCVAIAMIACRYEAPPAEESRPQLRTRTVWLRTDLTGKRFKQKFVLQPNVLSRCEAGAELGPDGLVSVPATEFRPADRIHLSMWLRQAPNELQVSMRVVDAEGNEIGVARLNDVGGVKAVTLHVGEDLEPGNYKLEGFWGGNLVCEKAISVRPEG